MSKNTAVKCSSNSGETKEMTFKVYIRATKIVSGKDLDKELEKIREMVKDIHGAIIHVDPVPVEGEEEKK